MIIEGKAKLNVKIPKKISKEMDVFYNPNMELNRSLSVLLLNSIDKNNIRVGLPLAGSGVRGIRFLKELQKGKISEIVFNDQDRKCVSNIKSNLKLNKLKLCAKHNSKLEIINKEANEFLLSTCGFDYIDIDPFGTPNPFLDSAAKRISRGGLLGVTATDTSALCGTYPKACARKYWAKMVKGSSMHEYGLRILIRKCQLVASQYDKALLPIFSYSHDHYMRVFFKCEKSKGKVNDILKNHKTLHDLGPMYIGTLWDINLIMKMKKKNTDDLLTKILHTIYNESKIGSIGFYSLPLLSKKNKLQGIPKQDTVIQEIKNKKYKVALTHFAENSLRSDISEKELNRILKKTNKG